MISLAAIDQFEALGAPAPQARFLDDALVVVAHPDDEVIGLGARLPRLRRARFVYVTDGAPRDMQDAMALGLSTRQAYIRKRRNEMLAALALAGIAPSQVIGLGCADQEASLMLPRLTQRLVELFRQYNPYLVLTHPYEGGHPDHDATAFAVHTAAHLFEHEGGTPPQITEFTSYHGRGGQLSTGDFLPHEHIVTVTCTLSEAEQRLKQRLLACHSSQARVLQAFRVDCERFRAAPHYDFTQPPHEGALWYEQFNWGMQGIRWRHLAEEALEILGVSHHAV